MDDTASALKPQAPPMHPFRLLWRAITISLHLVFTVAVSCYCFINVFAMSFSVLGHAVTMPGQLPVLAGVLVALLEEVLALAAFLGVMLMFTLVPHIMLASGYTSTEESHMQWVRRFAVVPAMASLVAAGLALIFMLAGLFQ